jgi:hypothetical protein
LKEARKKLDRAEDIVALSIKALAVAVSVAAAITAPNPGAISSAISAGVGLVKDIIAAAK